MRTTSTPHLTCCCNPSSLPRRATMSSLNITKLLVPSTSWSHIMQSNSPYSLLRSRSPQLWIESLLIHGQTTRCVSSSQPSWIHLPPFPSLQSLVYLVAAELGLPDWDCRPVSSMHQRFLGSSWTSHRQTHTVYITKYIDLAHTAVDSTRSALVMTVPYHPPFLFTFHLDY